MVLVLLAADLLCAYVLLLPRRVYMKGLNEGGTTCGFRLAKYAAGGCDAVAAALGCSPPAHELLAAAAAPRLFHLRLSLPKHTLPAFSLSLTGVLHTHQQAHEMVQKLIATHCWVLMKDHAAP